MSVPALPPSAAPDDAAAPEPGAGEPGGREAGAPEAPAGAHGGGEGGVSASASSAFADFIANSAPNMGDQPPAEPIVDDYAGGFGAGGSDGFEFGARTDEGAAGGGGETSAGPSASGAGANASGANASGGARGAFGGAGAPGANASGGATGRSSSSSSSAGGNSSRAHAHSAGVSAKTWVATFDMAVSKICAAVSDKPAAAYIMDSDEKAAYIEVTEEYFNAVEVNISPTTAFVLFTLMMALPNVYKAWQSKKEQDAAKRKWNARNPANKVNKVKITPGMRAHAETLRKQAYASSVAVDYEQNGHAVSGQDGDSDDDYDDGDAGGDYGDSGARANGTGATLIIDGKPYAATGVSDYGGDSPPLPIKGGDGLEPRTRFEPSRSNKHYKYTRDSKFANKGQREEIHPEVLIMWKKGFRSAEIRDKFGL